MPLKPTLCVLFICLAVFVVFSCGPAESESQAEAEAQTQTEAGGEAERFEHAGAAFSFVPPAGWLMRAAVNPHGLPYHVFSPDKAGDVDALQAGVWVFAVPIPTDQSLDTAHLGVVVAQVLTSDEPGLKATASKEPDAVLGKLPATRFEVQGKRRVAGDWRGRMLVAVQDDSYLVVVYGGPPEQWDNARQTAESALANFVAPVKHPPMDEPTLPDRTQRLRDVSDMLTAATPMIHAKARRRDAKDTWITVWTGSGFVIRDNGYVMTNRHVVDAGSGRSYVRESFDPVELSWDNSLGRANEVADVIAISHKDDLALLKIRGDGPWPAVPLASVANVKTGDRIVAVGWPAPSQFGDTSITQNEGSLTSIERDARARPTKLRHSARTTGGNSGGPVYDLDVGAVIGAHYQGLISHAKDFPEVLYHGAEPVHRILWDFPQVTTGIGADDELSPADRHALIAYYFLQERFGAAMIECRAALEKDPDDGVVNAYMFRISLLQGAPALAERCLELALDDPEARPLITAFAGRTALEVDDYMQALEWGERAVERRPDDPGGHLVRGHAQLGMGRFAEARASFETANKVSRGLSPEALSMVGVAPLLQWLSENNVTSLPVQTRPAAVVLHDARKHFQRSLELWPVRNWLPHLYLGLIAAIDGHERSAIQHRNQAYELVSGDADGLLAIAWFDLMYGEYVDALSSINQAQRIRTTARGHLFNGWALLMHSQALASADKTEQAHEAAQIAGVHYRLALQRSPAAAWAPAVKTLITQLPPP